MDDIRDEIRRIDSNTKQLISAARDDIGNYAINVELLALIKQNDAKKREEARVYALNVAAGIVKETFDVKDLEATKGLNVNEDVSEFRDADDWSLGSLTIDTDISSLHRGEADLNQSEMTVS